MKTMEDIEEKLVELQKDGAQNRQSADVATLKRLEEDYARLNSGLRHHTTHEKYENLTAIITQDLSTLRAQITALTQPAPEAPFIDIHPTQPAPTNANPPPPSEHSTTPPESTMRIHHAAANRQDPPKHVSTAPSKGDKEFIVQGTAEKYVQKVTGDFQYKPSENIPDNTLDKSLNAILQHCLKEGAPPLTIQGGPPDLLEKFKTLCDNQNIAYTSPQSSTLATVPHRP